MTARRSRRPRAAYAVLALGLTGSLALTGCNSHSSKKSKKTSSSSMKSKKSKKRRIISGGAAAGAGAGAGTAAQQRRSLCRPTPGSFRFASLTDPSHVILTYKNKSSSSCYLFNAPLLYRGEDGTKDMPYNRDKPLAFYDGEPGFMQDHRIQLAPGASAYASIPTKTASDKGKPQNLMYFGVAQYNGSKLQGTATALHFGRYDRHPSIGKTAKVGAWSRSLAGAEVDTKTGNTDK
ncbi:DUF4232 domain-containing protein [Streptomyces chattanoogensis]